MKTILGMIMFVALTVFQFMPLIGSMLIITGIVGFLFGSDFSGRAILIGFSILAFRYIVLLLFAKVLEKDR